MKDTSPTPWDYLDSKTIFLVEDMRQSGDHFEGTKTECAEWLFMQVYTDVDITTPYTIETVAEVEEPTEVFELPDHLKTQKILWLLITKRELYIPSIVIL